MVTIIIPVYNEGITVKELINRVTSLPLEKQIIVVNDSSTDKTLALLKTINDPSIKIINHDKNRGKGAAIRTGLEYAAGDITVIQDADLELNPADIIQLIKPLAEKRADAVLGVRIGYKKILLKHFLLAIITDLALDIFQIQLFLLYGRLVGDVMSCYKIIPTKLFKELNLKSDGFEIEVEIISKLLKQKSRIIELPIQYTPRLYNEGKKIKWFDALKVALSIIKYRFVD